MNISGSSVIQLIDKDGKITDEVINHNIVTNAVSNLLNGLQKYSLFYDRANLSTSIFNGIRENPIKKLYGGILVFSKSINQDINHIIPTVDEMSSFIGCATSDSSVAAISPYRGYFNSTESEEKSTDTQLVLVFEFPTDCCNGDIASVCLTSVLGGMSGYNIESYTDEKELASSLKYIYDTDIFNNANCFKDYNNQGSAQTMLSGLNKYMHSCYIDSNNTALIASSDSNIYSIHYDDSINFNKGIDIISSYSDANKSSDSMSVVRSTDSYDFFQTLHGDAIFELVSNSETSLVVKKHTLDSVSEISIPMTNYIADATSFFESHGVSPAGGYINNIGTKRAFIDDKILSIISAYDDTYTYHRVYYTSFDGSFITNEFKLENDTGLYKTNDTLRLVMSKDFFGGSEIAHTGVFYFDGDVFLSQYNYKQVNDWYYKQSYRITPGKEFSRMMLPDIQQYSYPISDNRYRAKYTFKTLRRSNVFPEPFLESDTMISGTGAYHGLYGRMSLRDCLLCTSYLATINNQQTVLTKTPDKTMKIIYTLTQS